MPTIYFFQKEITMNKEEMINEIQSLCKANKDNPYCSVYWLANMIKEIVDSPDLTESNHE